MHTQEHTVHTYVHVYKLNSHLQTVHTLTTAPIIAGCFDDSSMVLGRGFEKLNEKNDIV